MLQSCINYFFTHFEKYVSDHHILNNTSPVLCKHYPDMLNNSLSVNATTEIQAVCCNVSVDSLIICNGFFTEEILQRLGLHHNICPDDGGVNITDPLQQMLNNSSPLDEYDAITYILLALLMPLGLVGNLLILYAILKLKCLPRQTGNFLTSLALADIGVMIQYCFWFITIKAKVTLPGGLNDYFHPSLDIFFSALVLLQITAISIERSVAVTKPLKYPSLISVQRSKRIVYAIWLVALFFFLFSMSRILIVSETYQNFVFLAAASVLLLVPIIIIVVCYTMVLVCAYKNLSQDRKRLQMLATFLRRTHFKDSSPIVSPVENKEPSSSSTASSSRNSSTTTQHDENLKYRRNSIRCREFRLAINVAMIVLPFLGFWGTFLFISVYEMIKNIIFLGVINWLLPILPFLASCLNPILYLAFTRSLRKAVKSLIQRKVKSRLSRTEVSTLPIGSNTVIFGINNNNNNCRNISAPSFPLRKLAKDHSTEESQERLLVN